jgi:hypothetical protein
MSGKVSRSRARVEAELRGETAPELELAAARAWRRMCDRISPVIAQELGLGTELVEAYGNSYKRKYGPHLRLLQALQIALELKPRAEQRADVFAPLDWIEQQLGRHVIDVERARASNAPAPRAERIALAVLEVGEFLAAAAGDPERWTAEQRLRVHQELQGALAALAALADDLQALPQAAPVADIARSRR